MTLTNRLNVLGITLMVALCATPALANHVDTATVNASCNGYAISLAASALNPNTNYTITWTITLTPTSGSPITVTGSDPFFSQSFTTASTTLTENFPPLAGGYTLSGTATLVGFNTIPITFLHPTLSCPVPPPCLVSQLGSAGGFSILGLQGANIQLSSGPLQVNGNVGIGVNGRMHLSGGATLQSRLFADPSAQVQIDGGSGFSGGVVYQSMAAIQKAALAEAASVQSLPSTQTFSQITNATTIIGDGGQNVISVTGNFHLSGGNNLVISGGPNDTFYINVYHGLQLDGGANIALRGVSPSQVLFNFIGTQQLQTSGNANTAGIYLGTNPSQQVQINGGVHNSAFIFASNNFSFQSNPVVDRIACVQ